MRARLAIDIAGRACELREVVLADKPQALLQASCKGTVPVWVDEGGRVIDESLDIMRHVLTGASPDYLPNRNADWVQACDTFFKHHLDRYKYASRYDGDPEHHRQQAADYLSRLNLALQRPSDALDAPPAFLAGERQGWDDIAVAPFVRQFRLADPAWFDAQPWPNLHAWLARFVGSERFERVMYKYAPWQPGAAVTRFPCVAAGGHEAK